ncbi:MAG TPA: transposase [Usitatibacter sp.]|nr:transposase [Usitatibacter sp.]
MLTRRGFRFEVRARPAQLRHARRIAGACRWVWNRALALQKEAIAAGARRPHYLDLASELTTWRHAPDTAWLREAPIHPLQQTLRDLDRAWANCFERRARAPRFKRRGECHAFRFPDPKQFRLDEGNARVFLPKMHWLRYRKSREIAGTPKNITVVLEAGRLFVSVQTEQEKAAAVHPSADAVGVDLGVANFATLSTGERTAGILLERHLRRLARYQRRVARRAHGSKNQRRARDHVARVHRRLAAARRDLHHKLSTDLAQRFSAIAIEDLRVKDMSASAAGTADAPGRNVRAKSALNRSILAQGWSAFATMLAWKVEAAGGRLIAVPPAGTSQTCSHCGFRAAQNRTTQARFSCLACGHSEHADINAARNILARAATIAAGTAALPGGTGEVTPARYEKVHQGRSGQEPTEARSGACLPIPQ